MEENKITVSVVVNAPLIPVWEAWKDPKAIVKWNFASEDWECPEAVNNFEVGGTFTYKMAAKDGSASFDFTGLYTEIEGGKRIAYELGDVRKVEVLFEAIEGGTKITEIFDMEHENSRELQQNGWQAILNNFKKYVEGA